MGKQAYYGKNLSKYVNKIVHSKQEKKVIDEFFGAEILSTGTIWDLGQFRYIQKGDTLIERLGDSIDISSVSIRGTIVMPEPEASEQEPYGVYIRMVIFQWMDDESLNFPDPEDILSTYDPALPTGAIFPYSFYNKPNAGKFHILKDKLWTLSFYGDFIKTFKYTFSNMPVKTIPYNLIVGTPDFTPTTGAVFMLLITNSVTENRPTMNWCSRTVFTDS